MGLKGAAIGGVAGWFLGGPLGALCGAFFGNSLETKMRAGGTRAGNPRRPASAPHVRHDFVFCASAAAMLAKLAKADGVVTAEEIAAVELAFAKLGFSKATREYAVNVFRRAKDDRHTVYEYARDFAAAVPSVEVREFLYALLWDVACADGRLDPNERAILRQIPAALGIRPAWFEYYARERIRGYGSSRRPAGGAEERDPLAEAYAFLGASASDDDATLKRRYRDLAKRCHPDALRAQGLPDEMVGRATERMSKINEAWAKIRAARKL